MYDRHLILICDRETGEWSIMHESKDSESATRAALDKREGGDDSPMIEIDTADFINF